MVSIKITLQPGQSCKRALNFFLVRSFRHYVANVQNFRRLLIALMIGCIGHPLCAQKKNVRPEIVGQAPLTVEAGKPLTISLNDLIVVDSDDQYPQGFTLKIYKRGNEYSVTGVTVVPKIDFNGLLKVPVSVNDGKQDSKKFDLTITVTKGETIGDSPEDDDDTSGEDDDDNSGNDDDNPGEGNSGEGDSGDGSSGNANPGNANPGNVNVAPTITGQISLSTTEGTPLSIQFQHIYVVDPDDTYPEGFSLKILSGKNYTVKNRDIVPAKNFTGILNVPVIVNDGQASSEAYILVINVTPVNDDDNSGEGNSGEGDSGDGSSGNANPGNVNMAPTITGQMSLSATEDTPFSIQFQHIYVIDPDDTYPEGFSLKILSGKNYTVKNRDIVPAKNFTGMLSVPVIVSDGQASSEAYTLVINVTPVNDAPVLSDVEKNTINYIAGMGPVSVTQSLQISDPDGDEIVLAEISINPDHYREGYDRLIHDEAILQGSAIKGVFDAARGVLLFIGNGSATEYQHAMRSVQYDFLSDTDERVPDAAKMIYFTVSDGNMKSETVFREIDFNATVDIDIPRIFTPNGDMANDTWKVTPFITPGDYSGAIIRVYNLRGQLLYEANGFDGEWDGTYKGEYLPSDSYFYVISLNLSYKPVQYRGVITLLR